MICKWMIFVYLLMPFIVVSFTSGYIEADEYSEKGAELLNISLEEYRKKAAEEQKILEGLKKLLSLKKREVYRAEDTSKELVTENKQITVSRKTSSYGTVLYSIKADLVLIDEILETLASASGKKIIVDEDIEKDELSTVISLYLEDTPLVDIVDIVFGSKGFETIISEDLIFITLPAKLSVGSSYGYYQEKAIQTYQKVMIKYPDYKGIARAYFELGNFYLDSKFPSIALQEYKALIANYPDHPLARESTLNEGRCYELLDDLENAKRSYLSYVKSYPYSNDVDDIYLKIGNLLRKQKNYEKAIKIYNYIIKEYGDRDTVMDAHMQLGNSLIDSGDYSAALQILLSMKEKFQTDNQKPNMTENAQVNHRDNYEPAPSHSSSKSNEGKSITTSKRFVLPDKLQYELEYQLGNCYFLMGKYDEAISVLNYFVFHEKNNRMQDYAYYKLADCFFKKEDYLTAFQLYKNALTEFPNSSRSSHGYLYSGRALRKMKMLDNAIEILHKGLQQHQDSIYTDSIKFEIGLCYLDDENYKRAFDIFDEITKSNRSKDMMINANIYAGITLARVKQQEKAIERYQNVLKEDISEKRKDWISKLAGDSYSELGLFHEAVMAYQKGI